MESASWFKPTWRQNFSDRRIWASLAASVALGFAVAAAVKHYTIDPKLEINRKRFEATMDIASLYGLQLAHKKVTGTFANDLNSLLAGAPDGAAIKARLAANVDMNTVAVVGDAAKFKIEFNVLDPDRTSIKIRGPIAPRRPAAASAAVPEPPASSNPDGAPIAPAR